MIQPAPPPPTREEVAGTWMAMSAFDAYRLDLRPDGTGSLITGHHPEQAVIRRYTADEWLIEGSDVSAKFEPIDANGQPVYLRAVATREALYDVSLSLSDSGTVPVGTFIRERRLNEWMRLLRSEVEGE